MHSTGRFKPHDSIHYTRRGAESTLHVRSLYLRKRKEKLLSCPTTLLNISWGRAQTLLLLRQNMYCNTRLRKAFCANIWISDGPDPTSLSREFCSNFVSLPAWARCPFLGMSWCWLSGRTAAGRSLEDKNRNKIYLIYLDFGKKKWGHVFSRGYLWT